MPRSEISEGPLYYSLLDTAADQIVKSLDVHYLIYIIHFLNQAHFGQGQVS